MKILTEESNLPPPEIHISGDLFVARTEQIRILVSDLGNPDITQEQKHMLIKAINLLFHSCFMEIAEEVDVKSISGAVH